MASPEEDLPIDIYYNRLLDWLVDRKWVKKDWQKHTPAVRDLVTAAIMDMPDNETITALLARSYINYFHCTMIVEVLKSTEADSKTFFGSYSSQRMKDWQEVVRCYEQDNLYLGECANLLQHNVNYEIPALKRTVQRCQMKIKDADRKEVEYTAHGAQQRERFQQLCKDMKIEGKDVKKELSKLPKELPSIYQEAAEAMTSTQFKAALEYYTAFVAFILDGSDKQAEHSEAACALLKFIVANGNVTVHQFRTGEVVEPLSDPEDAPEEDAAIGGDAIDFGDDGGIDVGDDGGIDFGGDGGADIDFGDGDGIDFGEGAAIDFGDGTAGEGAIDFGDGGGIDFGDGDAEEDGAIEVAPPAEINRRLLLADSETRNLVVDQLRELLGFLAERLEESQAAVDVTSINQFFGAPNIIQMQSAESVSAMHDAVTVVDSLLTNSRTQQLVLMASSPRFVDRLVKSMNQRLELAAKMEKKVGELKAQRESAKEEIATTNPKLEAMVAQTKELQAKVELAIGKLYKARKVNIIGEINTL
eukprot:m.124848 g.124848  ORF g.124848 m.124848 type:complete len:530 (+) comp16636_c0_seq3:28-1617(+)